MFGVSYHCNGYLDVYIPPVMYIPLIAKYPLQWVLTCIYVHCNGYLQHTRMNSCSACRATEMPVALRLEQKKAKFTGLLCI
jgi:hypothetical protein